MSDDAPTPTLSDFFAGWELFGTPALAGLVAGLLLGALGVYIVVRRMVFLSAALSQSAGLGVALAFWVEVELLDDHAHRLPTVFATIATIATALLLFFGRSSGGRRDGLLGLAYLVGAAGTLAIGTRIVAEVHDIQTLLFGSAVVVLPEQLHGLLALAALVLAVHAWWMRGFVQASLDRDGARVRGVPVLALDVVLLVSLALSISYATRVLGALPVFAFSVLPALAALRSAANVHRALLGAAALGGLCGFLGDVVAFRYALPVGASQALVCAAAVVAAELVRVLRR